jgi:hypothetical protein
MFVLFLIFLSGTDGLHTSAAAIYYPTKEECRQSGVSIAEYQSGKEAAKAELKGGDAKPDTVMWFCLPLMPSDSEKGPTT